MRKIQRPFEWNGGQPAAFSTERRRELRGILRERLRGHSKRPRMKLVKQFLEGSLSERTLKSLTIEERIVKQFLEENLSEAERPMEPSTILTHIIRPAIDDIFPWRRSE